ncbi:MAG: hypothetical protein ACQESR_18155 [Planctomycetota bacterium]
MVSRLVSWVLALTTGGLIILLIEPVNAQSRKYAPGVLTLIPPDQQYEETYSGPSPLVEVTQGLPETNWDPHYTAKSRTVFEKSKRTVLRREIWCLEFAFKPLRTIHVDVPQASGKMQRKLIWYLVYRVRYVGEDLDPEPTTDKWDRTFYQPSLVSREHQYFFPRFVLETHEFDKSYQDRIIPAAKEPIQQREVDGDALLNTVEISQTPIPLSTPENPHEVWGVVTWEDVDPRVDFFSVFVRGLTNAYKPVDSPDSFEPGDEPGTNRDFLAKTLRLNFWRPGDGVREHEDRISFGVPYSRDPVRQKEILSAYGLKERLDYQWTYR